MKYLGLILGTALIGWRFWGGVIGFANEYTATREETAAPFRVQPPPRRTEPPKPSVWELKRREKVRQDHQRAMEAYKADVDSRAKH